MDIPLEAMRTQGLHKNRGIQVYKKEKKLPAAHKHFLQNIQKIQMYFTRKLNELRLRYSKFFFWVGGWLESKFCDQLWL